MNCLIIAAGQGSRLRQSADSKPLIPLKGVPLIEHVIAAARSGGADNFYVVSGYQGAALRSHLDHYAEATGTTIHHVVNERWQEPNGVSVLQAKSLLQTSFVLLMSDHLFDPEILRSLVTDSPPRDGVVLATDANLSNAMVDLSDVTRVYQENGLIREIGKGLKRFNAFDTGIFLCTPTLFDALEDSLDRFGDGSLSGGMRVLAEFERARSWDIGGRFWLDIDDSRAFVRAEVALDSQHNPSGLLNLQH